MTTLSTAQSTESGQAAALAKADMSGAALHPAFDRDKFLLKQKRLALTEKYAVSDEGGRQILNVQREAHHLRQVAALLAGTIAGFVGIAIAITPVILFVDGMTTPDWLLATLIILAIAIGAFAGIAVGLWLRPKRNVGFFTDQSMSEQVMTILQDKKFVFINATYTAADANLELLGWYRKNYLYDIFRKRWYVYGPSGELVCVAMEDSIWKSILRRIAREYLPLIRTNFILLAPDMTTKLGEFNRRFTLFDQYVLDLTPDTARRFDRRLAAGLGVLLDTGERR